MTKKPQTERDAIHEELSSYLDGELDAAGVARVEERLGRDAAYRAELARLEGAWRMLDELPRSYVGEDFAKSTIEMVAVAAGVDAADSTDDRPRRRIGQISGIVVVLAAGLFGFTLGDRLWSDPNTELLDDLSLFVRLERFYQADDMEFLQTLARQNLFVEPIDDQPKIAATADLTERRALVAAMSSAEQQALLGAQRRFAALPKADQDRLRALNAQIDAEPEAAKLDTVLENYHEWLKTLNVNQRGRLAESAPADRVEQITRMLNQQTQERRQQQVTESLLSEDLRTIRRWVDDVAWQHREELLAEMPAPRRENYERMRQPLQQRQSLTTFALNRGLRGGRGGGAWMFVDEQDFARLASQLSPRPAALLNGAADLQAKRQIASRWVALVTEPADGGPGGRRGAGIDGQELAEFIQRELPPEQRERLLKMPPDQMREEANALFAKRPTRRGMGSAREGQPREPGPRGRQPEGQRGGRGRGPRPGPPPPISEQEMRPQVP